MVIYIILVKLRTNSYNKITQNAVRTVPWGSNCLSTKSFIVFATKFVSSNWFSSLKLLTLWFISFNFSDSYIVKLSSKVKESALFTVSVGACPLAYTSNPCLKGSEKTAIIIINNKRKDSRKMETNN